MRIAICDDDKLFTEQLKKYLQDFFRRSRLSCPEIAVFFSGEDLLRNTNKKDIVFLDVEMPGLSGIYTGKMLKQQNKNVIIIITSSYAEYLDEAMRFQVFRYLSKPLERQRLFQNMKDALHVYSVSCAKLPIETKQGVISVLTSDIVMAEAVGRKVIVHTLKADYDSIRPMSYWIGILPANNFFQSHRSFIVNLAHVTDFDHTLIHLCGKQFQAYLTRRKYTEFKAAYLLYLESMR